MMRVAIIALILSVAALGLGSFATFASLNNDEATLVAESRWSAAECKGVSWTISVTDGNPGILLERCIFDGDCAPYADMLRAINDNCP